MASRHEKGCHEKSIPKHILVCKRRSNDDVGVARSTVIKEIQQGVVSKPAISLKKSWCAYRRTTYLLKRRFFGEWGGPTSLFSERGHKNSWCTSMMTRRPCMFRISKLPTVIIWALRCSSFQPRPWKFCWSRCTFPFTQQPVLGGGMWRPWSQERNRKNRRTPTVAARVLSYSQNLRQFRVYPLDACYGTEEVPLLPYVVWGFLLQELYIALPETDLGERIVPPYGQSSALGKQWKL